MISFCIYWGDQLTSLHSIRSYFIELRDDSVSLRYHSSRIGCARGFGDSSLHLLREDIDFMDEILLKFIHLCSGTIRSVHDYQEKQGSLESYSTFKQSVREGRFDLFYCPVIMQHLFTLADIQTVRYPR